MNAIPPEARCPLVSVIIPAYNSERFLKRAVDSALAQTYRPVEIVIVDDGSTDKTADVAGSIEGPVRYFHQENAGPAAARNRAIRESKGEIIALLDSDDEWLPERLEKTVAPMLEDPRIGLSYCQSHYILPDGRRLLHGKESAEKRHPHAVIPPHYIHTNAATFRREVFDRCGYFDQNIRGTEDGDLFIRVAEQYKTHLVEEPLTIYRARGDSISNTKSAEQGAEMTLRYVFKALGRAAVPINRDGALSAAYQTAGIYFFDAHRMWRARRYFLIAWLLWPTRRGFSFLARSFLPRFVNMTARKWREARQRKESLKDGDNNAD